MGSIVAAAAHMELNRKLTTVISSATDDPIRYRSILLVGLSPGISSAMAL